MMTRPFRFGVNHVTLEQAEWLDTARKAEALGYDTFIAQDHFGPQLAPMPALVAAAAVRRLACHSTRPPNDWSDSRKAFRSAKHSLGLKATR